MLAAWRIGRRKERGGGRKGIRILGIMIPLL
jgi:hypothetical protein